MNHLHDLTAKHGLCSVFEYFPYAWADVLEHEDCRMPYNVLKAQCYLVLLALSDLHAAGVAHGALQPSAVRLTHGLIPYIVGLEHSWTSDRRGARDERLCNRQRYHPETAGFETKKQGLIGYDLMRVKLLDLYAYGAMIAQALFDVKLDDSGHMPNAK
jgi:hypothetical protein